MLNKILNIIKNTLFRIDTRVLALFRIVFGLVMFFDILRRFPYIDLFYTDRGVLPISYLLSSPYKSLPFSLLPAFGASNEVILFFSVGMICCLFFILGFYTRLFQFFSVIAVLSIHNKVSMLENAGDTVMNNFMIISLFLPLGAAWSIDSLLKNLKLTKENSPIELNSYSPKSPEKVLSLSYFYCLIQLAMIYYFNYTNKSGGTWSEGTSLHYFFHLDTFLTPIGYWARYNLADSIKTFLTHFTIFIESTGPFLIFIPFFTQWIRFIYFLFFVCFHIGIAMFMDIGMFSHTMIAVDIFLLTGTQIDIISRYISKFCGKSILVVYDSSCGFCHQIVRIICRLDVYKKIRWEGKEWQENPDKIIMEQKKNTILVFFENNLKEYKIGSHAFYHILNKLPFGFLFSWVLILPGFKQICNFIYSIIANNRTNISVLLGLDGCGLPLNQSIGKENKPLVPFKTFCKKSWKIIASLSLSILMFGNINRAVVMNEPFKTDWDIKEKRFFRNVIKYLNMNQKWNMFSPNVKKSDSILIIDGITGDGTHIDPLTGNAPLDRANIDFENMDLNYGQFLRKYTTRISKRNDSPAMEPLKEWLLRGQYGNVIKKRPRLESFEIWKITQGSPAPGVKQRKNNKRLISKYPDDSYGNNKNIDRKKMPAKIGKRPNKLKKPVGSKIRK